MMPDAVWWLFGLGAGAIGLVVIGVFLGLWIVGKAVRRGIGKGLNW